jgi:signal transduction histidine kinase/CheY-like chemotaxis protein
MPERAEERVDRRTREYHEWQINRIALPDGGFGVVCYFRDISIHVRARNALQDADRQKNEFLAMLAHELRNPLAPIQNATAVLASTTLCDARAQFSVGAIKRQVTQLTRLVDDLLDVSRITQGRIELKHEPLELGGIVSQALEVVESLLREKNHDVSVASDGPPIYVLGDNARLVQCVGNILTNSAKYTDSGGAIRIQLCADGLTAVLRISDNGVGISPELLPNIFELFVQSERTLDRSQGGLGVGLSVVKRLVEMHGGRVDARSEGIGRGACFEIHLPQSAPAAEPVVDRPQSRIECLRVLIVDDNVDAADTLAMLLELDGHTTRAVYTSQDVLHQAPTFAPDVVLLDIGLPGMNGYEVAEKLRAMPALTGVLRLIAVTGYGKSEDHQRTKSSGFDDHLVKPVDPATLTAALARSADSQCTILP